MDSGKTDNERELTSTMDNVLSGSIKDEKNDTSDATPTSSTDANTTTTSSQIVSDDPISSTSSDVVEQNKTKILESSVEISQTEVEESDKASMDAETDLLEMSISSVSHERITEDVEDLVHDLESLLGETTDSFNIPVKRKDQKTPELKENIEKPQTSGETGDWSLENSVLVEEIKETQNCDTDGNVINDVCNPLPVEEKILAVECTTQEIESCSINVEDRQKIIDIASEPNEELPILEFPETKISSECKEIIDNLEVNKSDNEPNHASENVQEITSEGTECVPITTECSEEVGENIETDRNVDTYAPKSDVDNTNCIEEKTDEKIEIEENVTEIEVTEQVNEDTAKIEKVSGELSTKTSSDDYNVQINDLEQTEEDNTVCNEESISRDTKTETVESIDNESNETKNYNKVELESPVVENMPINDLIVTDHASNLEKEDITYTEDAQEKILEVTSEVVCSTYIESENKLTDDKIISSVSDNSENQPIFDQGDSAEAKDVENKIEATEEDGTNITELATITEDTEVSEPITQNLQDIDQVEEIELSTSKEEAGLEISPTMELLPVPVDEDLPTEIIENTETEDLVSSVPENSSPTQSFDVSENILATEVCLGDNDSKIANKDDSTLESTPEKIQDDLEISSSAIESATGEPTVVSQLITETVEVSADNSSPEVIESDVEEINSVININQQEVLHEPIDDVIVSKVEELPDATVNMKELEETEKETLTEKVDETLEEEKTQLEILPDKITVINLEEEIALEEGPTSVSYEAGEECSTTQLEMPQDSQSEVDASISGIKLDNVSDVPINLEEICSVIEPPEQSSIKLDNVSEVTTNLEEISSVIEPSEQEVSSKCDINADVIAVEEVSSISIITSKSVYSETSVIESVEITSSETSKLPDEIQVQSNQIILEEIAVGVDNQEPDVDLAEDVTKSDKAADNENFQEDEAENVSSVKIVEISDDESKTMKAETECVPFISSVPDSDSEDTVPALVLEPDEINPLPEQSNTEKEDIEILTLPIHSTDETEIPDKLPEIEEILNDEGNVDDVVENIDMQENLETILAVATLQNTESTIDVEVSVAEPLISDKERREMEALRKAVESITETPTIDYGDVDDMTEIVKDASTPLQSVLPESEPLNNLIEKIDSDLKEEQADRLEETVELTAEVNDSVNKSDEGTEISESCTTSEPVLSTTDVNLQTIPDSSNDDVRPSKKGTPNIPVLPDSSRTIPVSDENKWTESHKEKEGKTKVNEKPKKHKKSSADNKLEELSINVDVPEREKPYSPKVTIKPIKVPDEEVSTTSNSDAEIGKGSLKMTITKQSDKMHSILKICESENSESPQEQDEPIPKLIIKPKIQQVEQQHSPKMSTRSSKQMYSPTSSSQRSGSPRITIKPVIKPDKVESITSLKIKIKPEEGSKKHSPKLNIKPLTKSEEECRENIQSPRKVTIKPIVKSDDIEQVQSPRITIKPILKPDSEKESTSITPKINIKPIKKQDEDDIDIDRERSSPKIIIKPLIKPQESDMQTSEPEDEIKERIVLKINKGNLPTPTKESKKREHPPDDEKSEKLAKITVKFSKGGGHPHIVHQPEESIKRTHEEPTSPEKVKKLKVESESPVLTRSKHKDVEVESHIVETRSKHSHVICEAPIEAKRAKLKEALEISPYESPRSKLKENIGESPRSRINNENEDVRIVEAVHNSPIVISEDSRSQDSGSCIIIEDPKDPLENIPTYEISMQATSETSPAAVLKQGGTASTPTTSTTPVPRKRGRPRKVPIVVQEELRDPEGPTKLEPPKKQESQAIHESGRPKRSCRGQSARQTLGIKPRKPRGPGRGRGSKRGMGTRVVPMKPEREPKLSKEKLKVIQETLKGELLRTDDNTEKEEKKIIEPVEIIDDDIKPPAPVLTQREELPSEAPSPTLLFPEPFRQDPIPSPVSLPAASPKPVSSLLIAEVADVACVPSATPSTSRTEPAEIVMVDEETRMSADTNSRAQTPAKQVIPVDGVIEESQSSVQSTGTTESGKAASSRPNKAPRLEVQEPEGAVISADQLTEYYWNGNGPFMLQEQVAQFLGIKSFKRKYPGIMRRMLEMQERDFIRESGLASEHMCDLGLTAVNSVDILDIMYSDFQEKYEEYCKHQRDRQAKELINKQKALSLAASQEKTKADITEQAVQSAAQWNASFNKARKEQRKACMDLQTLTVHYPKGKIKQINKPKVGNYPVALVPGQFTDYYKEFTPTEINNLPLSTLCYEPINIIPPEESDDSGSDGSDSDSDSSSSSSGSCSSSSGVEDCKLCKHTPKKGVSK